MPRHDSWSNAPAPLPCGAGQTYFREAEVDDQINRLHALPKTVRQRQLVGDSRRVREREWREETMVYAIRRYTADGDIETAEGLLQLLMARVSGHVESMIKRYRLPSDALEDVIGEFALWFCQALPSSDPGEAFGEVRFWVWIDRRLNKILVRYAKVRQREPNETELTRETEGETGLSAQWVDPRLGPEDLALLRSLLSGLSFEDRELLEAKFVHGIPEATTNPREPSLEKMFGISARAIRYRLNRILKTLRGGES